MKHPRTTAAAATLTCATGLLAMLTACGGQGERPAAGSSPSATMSAATPRQPATSSPPVTPSQPSSGTSSPAQSDQVRAFRLAYPWHWPNDVAMPGRVSHPVVVPRVPELVRISVGSHPGGPGERPFNRMSFTFTTAFPSYRFQFASELVSDPGGQVIPLSGQGVLEIVFTQ